MEVRRVITSGSHRRWGSLETVTLAMVGAFRRLRTSAVRLQTIARMRLTLTVCSSRGEELKLREGSELEWSCGSDIT